MKHHEVTFLPVLKEGVTKLGSDRHKLESQKGMILLDWQERTNSIWLVAGFFQRLSRGNLMYKAFPPL